MAKTAARELAGILVNQRSMQANFVEKSAKSSHSKLVFKSYGQVSIQRPGKFRWEIKHPFKQLLIADGRYIWIYDKDLAQVTRKKIDYRQLNSPILLLNDSIEILEKTFLITKISGENSSDLWFELKPKIANESNCIQSVRLHFVSGTLTTMQITDNLGQYSNLDFSDSKINNILPRILFEFNPPRGVDVIEN
jgi:outer membrane lipoprotein carrier protein